jgi:hypothetical protein
MKIILCGTMVILCSLGFSGCISSAYLVSQGFYAADDVRLSAYEDKLKDASLSDLINIYIHLSYSYDNDQRGDLAKQFGFVGDKDLYYVVRAELGKRFEYGIDELPVDIECAAHFYRSSNQYAGGDDVPIHWFEPSKAGMERLNAKAQKVERYIGLETFYSEDTRCLALLTEASTK